MVTVQIHNKYKELTETEKKLATYVLHFPQEVTRMTAKELAEACTTAPSAVIRFCKAMGFHGFSEFKLSLAEELGTNQKSTVTRLPAFSENDSPSDVFRKVFGSGIHTLEDTLGMIDFIQVEAISRLLADAERIYIFGIGTSSVIAIDAQYRFTQMGLRATACTDILFMNVTAVNMKKGDVALAISHSGRTRAVVDAMRHAKTAGATTVAITSFAGSLLAKESDFAVCVFADEENYPVEAVSARVAHICLIDAFMMTVATLNHEEFTKHISNRNHILDEIRY